MHEGGEAAVSDQVYEHRRRKHEPAIAGTGGVLQDHFLLWLSVWRAMEPIQIPSLEFGDRRAEGSETDVSTRYHGGRKSGSGDIRSGDQAASESSTRPYEYSQFNSLVFLIVYLSWTFCLALLTLSFFGYMLCLTFKIVKAALLGDVDDSGQARSRYGAATATLSRESTNAVEGENTLCAPLVVTN